MVTLLTIIHVIVCFALIGIILLQPGRGQGLSGAAFGGNVQSALGTRASDVLSKATTICAVLFLITCVGISFIASQKSRSLYKKMASQDSPLNLDQIQKALQEIETEEAAADAVSETAGSSQAAVDKLVAEAEKASAEIAQEVKETSENASKALDDISAEAK